MTIFGNRHAHLATTTLEIIGCSRRQGKAQLATAT
jgi:hypothetical protein